MTAGSLIACLTLGATLGACSSSSQRDAVRDAQSGGDADPCSLGGSFHVAFAPTAGSPSACACSHCSYDAALGHITDSLSLAEANVEYFLGPLLTPDGGLPPYYGCDSTETSACTFTGNCLSDFTFTVTNGAASGTQSIGFKDPESGALVTCTYEVTATPCDPVGSAQCTF